MLSSKITVPVPKRTNREYKSPLLCGPGPCDLWPSVAEALTKPVVSPLSDEYQNIIEDIRAGLKYLFQTQSNLVLAISGSGHAGMETVISNLTGPKETLLIASRGTWDDRAFNMATRYGINAVQLRIPFDTTFTFDQIEAELKKLKPTAVFITHGDSSTGTVQNLEGLGNICHKYGALLLVDTVVSIGGVPFFMDEWGVDAVYASTQKALSGPAGISPVAFSARAEENEKQKIPATILLRHNAVGTAVELLRKHSSVSTILISNLNIDIRSLLFRNTLYYTERMKYHHTMSPPLMWALSSCLEEIGKHTLPLCWKQHAETTLYFHKRLEENGFKLLVPKIEDRLATATTVQLPQGYDHPEFCRYISDIHNISISCGSGPTVGKALRIGVMGVNCTKNVADTVIDAMVDAIKALKKSS